MKTLLALAMTSMVALSPVCHADEPTAATHYKDLTGLLDLLYDATQYDVVKTGGATDAKAIFTTKGTRSNCLFFMVMSKTWLKARTSNDDTEHIAALVALELAKGGFVYTNEFSSPGTCNARRFTIDAGKPVELTLWVITGTNEKGYCVVYLLRQSGAARIDTDEIDGKTAYLYGCARTAMMNASIAATFGK